MISRAMEDYLKVIYLLAGDSGRASTTQLAQRMKCSAASVTNMLQKLSDLKLVSYTPYQGVILTPSGCKVALEVLRHHRLLELYLKEALGFTWDQVHDEAELLEHVMSDELEERIDRALGYPTHDPHGHPIPSREGFVPDEAGHTLWDTRGPRRVRVASVDDENPEVLRTLADLGIFPETAIDVLERQRGESGIQVTVGDREYTLPEELARQVYVAPSGTVSSL